jgi:predicted site-specific integrase-resolvase
MRSKPESCCADAGEVPDLAIRHLTPAELAKRWRITRRTLDRWRVAGTCAPWLHLNGRIVFRLHDVLAFEQAHRTGA